MNDNREEEKIITKTSHRSRKKNQSKSINDPRTESRKRLKKYLKMIQESNFKTS